MLSPHRLAVAEDVSLAVPEPRRPLADAALGRVVARDLGDAVNGIQARQVVLLEYDSVVSQLRDRRLDVVDAPRHLGVGAGCAARRLEDRELAVAAAVPKPSRS